VLNSVSEKRTELTPQSPPGGAEEQDATLAKTWCSRGPCDEMVRRKEPWAR